MLANKHWKWMRLSALLIVEGLLLAGCAVPAEPVVIEKEVTQVVKETVIVEKQVTPVVPAQVQSLTIEKTWGGTDGHGDLGWGVAVDSSGNVYVSGETGSFGAGGVDVFLLKYGPDGTLLWQKTWGGTKDDWGWGVAVDSSGNVYVSGETHSFGAGGGDAFLLKYDSNGTILWQKIWGSIEDDFSLGVAVDASGNAYVIGGTTSFGAGLSDVLLLKYDPNGRLLWKRTWGGEEYDKVFGVAVDPSGNAYVTGGTESFGAGQRMFYCLSMALTVRFYGRGPGEEKTLI